MEKHFEEKFRTKSQADLAKIVANPEDYQAAAVRAAAKLLQEKHNVPVSIPTELEKTAQQENKKPVRKDEFDFLTKSFDARPFARSLSYREFLTCFVLAILFHALFALIHYYSDERSFQDTHLIWKFSVLVIVFFANHIYYKLEHGRVNNFIGRTTTDLLLVIFLVATRYAYELILDSSFRLDLSANGLGAVGIILTFVFVAFAFEGFVSLMRLLLKQVRCQLF